MDRKDIMKWMRLVRNVPQMDLAPQLGVSQGTYGRIEIGEVKLTDEFYERVCNLLKFDPAWDPYSPNAWDCMKDLPLHEKIRLARRVLNIPQKEMAAEMQMCSSTYSRVETGDALLTIDVYAALCWKIGLNPGDLLNFHFPGPNKRPAEMGSSLYQPPEKAA